MGCGASLAGNDARPATNQSCRTIELSVCSDGESGENEDHPSLPTAAYPEQHRTESGVMPQQIHNEKESVTMDGEIAQKMLFGDLSVEFAEDFKIVRIFTSSTFTDTSVERNTLMTRVYPRLKAFCREKGYDFQVVDLRWGIREEAVDDHILTELCMKEIKACQKLSTGPNFITFLGQKYGYRPLPHKINSAEFESLLTAISNPDELDLVNYWYWRDDNNVPPEYVLQPISSRLPHFRNKEHAQLRREAADKWWAAYERIHMILRKAADDVLDKTRARKYHMSVTEEEIRAGVLDSTKPGKQCFWFKRVISDLREHSSKPKAPLFIDKDRMHTAIDEVAQSLLEVLKEDEITSNLPNNNIVTYNVHWNDQGIDPESSEEHERYIEGLCIHFYDTLKRAIQDAIAEKEDHVMGDALSKELQDQGTFCQRKCETFHGRDAFLRSVKERLQIQSPDRVVVVYGESGCGKTSIMAKVAMEMKAWMEISKTSPCVVLYRFLGTSPDSSSPRLLLHSMCTQLCRVSGHPVAKIPEDYKSLSEFFPQCLARAAQSHPIVLVLDSLDQLTGEALGQEFDWWPRHLPDNVCAVLSTLPDEKYRCLPYLKAMLPDSCFMEVPKLSFNEADAILDGWLTDAKRCLQPHQRRTVLEAFKACELPLYLKLAFDEAIRWKSYSAAQDTTLQPDVKGIINALFDRLERSHGNILVASVFGYLAASKSGLTQPELEDLLSLDDTVLNDIYQFWTPPIRRMIPLLWFRLHADVQDYLIEKGADGIPVVYWYHRQFIETATERYLTGDKSIGIHQNMVDFFSGKWADGAKKPYKNKDGELVAKDRLVAKQPLMFDENPDKPVFNMRKLHELPRHLLHSRELSELKELALCNFDFLLAKLRATSLDEVIEDVSAATDIFTEDKELLMVEQFLHLSSMALRNDARQFTSQVLGRLGQCMENEQEFPFLSKLVRRASSASLTGFPTFVSSHKCLTSPGGVLVSSTTVNDQNAHCAFSCNGKTVFVGFTSKLGLDIQVLAISTGKRIGRAAYRLPEAERPSRWVLRASRINEDVVLAGGAHYLLLLDTNTRQIIHRYQALSKPMFNFVYPFAFCEDENKVAALSDTGIKMFDVASEEVAHFIPVEGGVSIEATKALDAKGCYVVYSTDEDGFHIFNTETGEQSTAFKLDEKVKEIKITSRNEIVIMTAKRKKLFIYDLFSQVLIRMVPGFEAYFGLNRLQITRNGEYAVSFTDKEILISNLKTCEIKKINKFEIFEEGIDCCCLYSDDATKLFSVCYDKVTRLYSLDKMDSCGNGVSDRRVHQSGIISTVYPGNDDRYLATKAIVNGQKELQMWKVRGDKPKVMDKPEVMGKPEVITKPEVMIKPEVVDKPEVVRSLKYEYGLNELRMYSNATKGVLKIFSQASESFMFGVIDMIEGRIVRILPGDASLLWAIGFSDDSHFIAFSRDMGYLKVWNTAKGTVTNKYRLGKKKPISEALMSRNGQVIVCALLQGDPKSEGTPGGSRGTLPLVAFDCKTAKHRVLKIKKEEMKLQGASITPEGDSLVALTTDGKPSIWGLLTGKLLIHLAVQGVTATNVSSSAKIVVTCRGQTNCVLQMWDMESGACLAGFDTEQTHKLLMSPSGHVAYTFYGNNFHAWDLKKKKNLANITLDWEAKPMHVYAVGDALVFPVPESPVLMALRINGMGSNSGEEGTSQDVYSNVTLDGKLLLF